MADASESPTVSVVTIDLLGPGELDAAIVVVATEQVRPERNISYVGMDVLGIRAELDALDPPWPETVRIVLSVGRVDRGSGGSRARFRSRACVDLRAVGRG